MIDSILLNKIKIARKKILLIGSSGCLGKALKFEIEKKLGKEYVYCLPSEFFSQQTWKDDLCSIMKTHVFSSIIYAAQSRQYRNYPDGLSDVIKVNLLIPIDILQLANKFQINFVYCSTGSVYARSTIPITEDAPLVSESGLNAYIASKLFAEKIMLDNVKISEVLIIRPFYIFGKGSRRPNLFPSLLDSISKGERIRISGEKGLILNPISSENAAQAIFFLIAMDQKGIFNLGGDESTSLKEVVDIFSISLKKNANIEQVPESDQFVVSDQSKLAKIGFNYSGTLRQDLMTYSKNPN